VDDNFRLDRPIDLTISSLDEDVDVVERDKQALEPVRVSLAAAGFYAYTTYDDQQRWSVAVDDEAGRVDVRVGMDGYHIEMWASSPGMFADEENEWKRRAQQRLVRIVLPNIARGHLAENQHASWDEVDQGIAVRVSYELPFTRVEQIGPFVRQHLPELEDLLTLVESQIEI
jgi:hypothetical protein